MTINPNQIFALLAAALLGNLLILQLWRVPPCDRTTWTGKLRLPLLLALFPLALFYAGWEMYWNRSEDVMLGLLLYLPLQAIVTALCFFRYNRRCGVPPGWPRLLAGNLLILAVLLTSLLALGEVYFRFLYDTTDSFAYTKVAQRWIQRHYHFNKAKLRDNVEYERKLQAGKRRITFVGDSFTAGHGIKNVEDRFSNRLRQRHADWEVHVAAGNGLDTGAELGFLQVQTGLGYELDQVVLVYCLNDVNDLLVDWGPILETGGGKANLRLPFLEDSYFLDLLYHRLVIARIPWVRNYFSFVRDAYRGEIWAQQQQRLRALRDVVERHGGQLTVVTFPFLHALGPDYPYQFVHDELDEFWRQERVPHLDLLPVFRNMSPREITVNRFDAHPNELAHELAANAIEAFLREHFRTNAIPARAAAVAVPASESRPGLR